MWKYRGIYLLGDTNFGQWSDAVEITVGGGSADGALAERWHRGGAVSSREVGSSAQVRRAADSRC